MMTEAFPQAAAVLLEAGWRPHDQWGVYTYQTLVMGFDPSGKGFHVKNWGKDVHGPDYPDDPVEAAHWLVARFAAPVVQEIIPEPVHEVPEPVREESGDAPDQAPDSVGLGDGDAAGGDQGGAGDGAADRGDSLLAGDGQAWAGDSDVLDADYDEAADAERLALAPPEEPALEGADFTHLFLPEPDEADFVCPEDFAPDPVKPVSEGVVLFGDDLPRNRLLLIGRVTQLAAEFKSVLQEGWTVAEFSELQNHVMRISQGLAPDDEHVRARFGALSEASRAMNAIDAHAEAQVAFLESATREQIEAYKPEEGWP